MSIVAMKKKMEAKKGVSVGGGFSLNGKYNNSQARVTSVRSSRFARKNYFQTRAAFKGDEGLISERVWDGKKMDRNCETCGDPKTQDEYISEKRYTAARCRNLLWTGANVGQSVKVVLVNGKHKIEFNGKQYDVHWNRDDSIVGGFVGVTFTIETVQVNGARETIIKNGADTLSLQNPEIAIYEVNCINNKPVYVNKDRLFEPNGYGGIGGYLDDLKQPNVDISFCG